MLVRGMGFVAWECYVCLYVIVYIWVGIIMVGLL